MCYDNVDDAVKCKFCCSTTTILATSLTNNCKNIVSISSTTAEAQIKMSNSSSSSRSGTKSPTTSKQYACPSASPSCLKQTAASDQEEDLDQEQQTAMNAEIEAAVTFLTDLIKAAQFSAQTAEHFRKALTDLLGQYYDGHWYPDEPLKGSGYRCLRVNGVMNPLLKKAAQLCNMPLNKFRLAFPVELTVWVDPGDVSVRFGEEGSIGVYYAKKGVCLKHDHQQMEDFQRLTATKRASPQHCFTNNSGTSGFAGSNSVVVNAVNTAAASNRSSPALSYVYNNPPLLKSGSPQLQVQQQQSPPRKILPFLGGRHTPTAPSSFQQQQQQQSGQQPGQYGQQQSMMFTGYGSSPDHHHHHYQQQQQQQQQQQLYHHQSPHHQLFDYGSSPVRRPSPSPSPPEPSSTIGDWWKSEYHQQMAAYGNNTNSNFGSVVNSQLPHYGRFARMMNVCARQEPVGAN